MDIYDIARITPNSGIRWSEESILKPEEWTREAACLEVDPENFFADTAKGDKKRTEDARAICETKCRVRDECLAYALRNGEEHGLWGGYTAKERKALTGKKPSTPQLRRECARGHEFTEANTRHRTFTAPDGSQKRRRDCLTCERDANERKKARGVR